MTPTLFSIRVGERRTGSRLLRQLDGKAPLRLITNRDTGDETDAAPEIVEPPSKPSLAIDILTNKRGVDYFQLTVDHQRDGRAVRTITSHESLHALVERVKAWLR